MNKQVFTNKNRVAKIIKYPEDHMLYSIAKHHGKIADKVISGLTNIIATAHRNSDFFCVIMYDVNGESIGCANFIQSSLEPSKWFYTDLWVLPECRRQGCGTGIVNEGIRYLSDLNAKILLCTVDTENEASLNFQKSLGFEQIETEPFEDFEVDDLIMFKKEIEQNFNIVPLKDDFTHLDFICGLLKTSKDGQREFYKETREKLISNAKDDELSYIVRKGVVPIAYLRLNIVSGDRVQKSELIIHEKYKNLDVETFALNFIRKFALSTEHKS